MNLPKPVEPEFLYKIVSTNQWQRSQTQDFIEIGSIDTDFIHLALKEQLTSILTKFWKDDPSALILKVRTSKLRGRLVKERNPGGTTEYYHLYDGAVPKDAVVEVLTRRDLP